MDAILKSIESFLYQFLTSIAEPLQHFSEEYPLITLIIVMLSPIWLWFLARFSFELINELSYQKCRLIRWFRSKMEESEDAEK